MPPRPGVDRPRAPHPALAVRRSGLERCCKSAADPTAGQRPAGFPALGVAHRSNSQADRRADHLEANRGPGPDGLLFPRSAPVRVVAGSPGRRAARPDPDQARMVLAPPRPGDPQSDRRAGASPRAGADDRAALVLGARVVLGRDAYWGRIRGRAETWVRVRVLRLIAGPAGRGLLETTGMVPGGNPDAGRDAGPTHRPGAIRGADRDGAPADVGQPRNRRMAATCRRVRLALATRLRGPSGATSSPRVARADLVSASGSCRAFDPVPALAVPRVLDGDAALEQRVAELVGSGPLPGGPSGFTGVKHGA